MDIVQNHIIQYEVVEIGGCSRLRAVELQNRVSRMAGNMTAIMEEIFERLVGPGTLIRIDELQLDIGTIPYEHFENYFMERFAAMLEKELRARINAKSAVIIPGQQHAEDGQFLITCLDLLEYFLVRGTLPWWAGGKLLGNPPGVMDWLLRDEPAALRLLILQVGQTGAVRQRLVYQFPDRTIHALVTLLEPGQAVFMLAYHSSLSKVQQLKRIIPATLNEFERAVWLFMLSYLLVDRGNQFNRKQFVRSTLNRMALHFNRDYLQLLGLFTSVLPADDPVFQLTGALPHILKELAAEQELIPEERGETREKTLRAKRELIRYYLAHGSLPLPAASLHPMELSGIFSMIIKHIPVSVKEMMGGFNDIPEVPRRIVMVMEEPVVLSLIVLLEPSGAPFINRYLESLPILQQQRPIVNMGYKDFGKAIQEVVLGFLLWERGSVFNTKIFLKSHIQGMARHFNITYGVLLMGMLQGWEQEALSGGAIFLTLLKTLLDEDGKEMKGQAERAADHVARQMEERKTGRTAQGMEEEEKGRIVQRMEEQEAARKRKEAAEQGASQKKDEAAALMAGMETEGKTAQVITGKTDLVAERKTERGVEKKIDLVTEKTDQGAERKIDLAVEGKTDMGAGKITGHVMERKTDMAVGGIRDMGTGKQTDQHAERKTGQGAEKETALGAAKTDLAAERISDLVAEEKERLAKGINREIRCRDILQYWLQYGQMPWWSAETERSPEAMWKELMDRWPRTIVSLLRWAGKAAVRRDRLISLLSVEGVLEMIRSLPGGKPAVDHYYTLLSLTGKKGALRIRNNADHRFLLLAALWDTGMEGGFVRWDEHDFVRKVILRLAGWTRVYPSVLARALWRAAAGQTALGREGLANPALSAILEAAAGKDWEDGRLLEERKLEGNMTEEQSAIWEESRKRAAFREEEASSEERALQEKEKSGEESVFGEDEKSRSRQQEEERQFLGEEVFGAEDEFGVKDELGENRKPGENGASDDNEAFDEQGALWEDEAFWREIDEKAGPWKEGDRRLEKQKSREEEWTWEEPEGQRRKKKKIDMMEETIYIGNAGLVLLHPFLSPYFTRLGLLESKEFTGEAAQYRAVHLLQYLVDGLEEHPEQELALNKLLCGLPVDEPVPLRLTLTDQEKEVSDELLHVVRVQWEKLKNTSIEGLRVSFLQRPGALTEMEEGWKLRVEQRTYDVLLQTLPWGLGMIKLSWMKKIIYTEWS